MQKLEVRPQHTNYRFAQLPFTPKQNAITIYKNDKTLFQCKNFKIDLYYVKYKRNTARHADYNERGKEKNTTRKRIILRTNFSSTTPGNFNWDYTHPLAHLFRYLIPEVIHDIPAEFCGGKFSPSTVFKMQKWPETRSGSTWVRVARSELPLLHGRRSTFDHVMFMLQENACQTLADKSSDR